MNGNGAASGRAAARADSAVHEFSVPTPIPGMIPSLDLMQEGGSAGPAAVRDLIARVQELLLDTRRRTRGRRTRAARTRHLTVRAA